MKWTEERRGMLAAMWLSGFGSKTIAARIGGVSRHAVMGAIDRNGLMGCQGQGMLGHTSIDKLRAAVDEQVRDAEFAADQIAIKRAYGAIWIMLLVGRDSPRLMDIAGNDENRAALAHPHLASIWPAGGPPPLAWFEDDGGLIALTIDAMAIAGKISAQVDADGIARYSIADQNDAHSKRKTA